MQEKRQRRQEKRWRVQRWREQRWMQCKLKQLRKQSVEQVDVQKLKQLLEQELLQLQKQKPELKQLRELEWELEQLWQLELVKLLKRCPAKVGGEELEQLRKKCQKLKLLHELNWKLGQLQGEWQAMGHEGRRLEWLWEQILLWVSKWKHKWELDQQWELKQEWKLMRELEWQFELEHKRMREWVWEWQGELERKKKWELKKRELGLGLEQQLEQQWQQQRLYQRQRLQDLKGNQTWNRKKQQMQEQRWWELEQMEMWEREREWERVQKGMQEFRNLSSRKTKQKALFSSKFPQRSSVVAKSIATVFTSSDTVISVSSDSSLALWNHRMDEERGFSFKFISESSLSSSLSQLSHIDNWVFSDDGKRAACHQGNKIQLYRIEPSVTILSTLLEGDIFDTGLVSLTFSADNILLLICIQDGKNEPRYYEWNVEKRIMSSFKSPFLTVECCCLSSDKTKFILCGEYEIEIWEYNKGPICLLARGGIAQKFSVRYIYCTVSLDNDLLVCCIANIILVFRLCACDIFSSKQILRGHIGRIEFCKFLRVNRYLISYGVDGMVFLWDLIEAKAVGFARITQGQENIVSVAVSPEEERVVCFTSSARVCVMRLWNLEGALSSKLVRESMKGKAEVTHSSLQMAGEIVSMSKPIASVDDCKSTDVSSPEEDERFCITSEDFLGSGNESD